MRASDVSECKHVISQNVSMWYLRVWACDVSEFEHVMS